VRWFAIILASGIAGAAASLAAMLTGWGQVSTLSNSVSLIRGAALVVLAVVIYEALVHELRVGWLAVHSGLGAPLPKLILERMLVFYAAVAAYVIGALASSVELLTLPAIEHLALQIVGDASVVALVGSLVPMAVPILRNEFIILLAGVAGGLRQYAFIAAGLFTSFLPKSLCMQGALAWYPMLDAARFSQKPLPPNVLALSIVFDAALIALALTLPPKVFMRRCVRL